MLKTINIDLVYMPYIGKPPIDDKQMYAMACANDGVTMDSWREIWKKNITSNHEKFKSFKEHGTQSLVDKFRHRPCIIAGSGSSLKNNAHFLKDRGDIGLISCLHNYAFLEDLGVVPDYYLTLDAGEVVIPEMFQGGKEKPEYYIEKSKDRKLLAYIGSDPKLWDNWKGEVFLFNCPVNDPEVLKLTNPTINRDGTKNEPLIESFGAHVSTGGNALGACMYFAKAVGGANPIIFVGADFSFGYERKFHPWGSPYDAMAQGGFYHPNVYGIKVFTWQSYFNFKVWFENVACYRSPGWYINCTEGGILGAWPDGNIGQIQLMDLAECIARYNHYQKKPEGFEQNVPDGFKNPEKNVQLVLY